jgi:hypothetical protein
MGVSLRRIFVVFFGVALIGLSLVSAPAVFADRSSIDKICNDATMAEQAGCDNTTEAQDLVGDIIRTVMWVAGVVAVAFIIYGGVLYMISGGDSTKAQTAKTVIQYAVIGLVIVILAYAIVAFVTGRVL